MDPENALRRGNKRFVRLKHKTIARMAGLALNGQKPFAVVLTCIDSRIRPRAIFGLKEGDITVLKNPGNAASPETVAKIAFACEALGPKFVLVLGHTGCGAVAAAREPEKLSELARPAVQHVCGCSEQENVEHGVQILREKTPEDIIVKGAILDLATGAVEFLEV